MQAKDQKSDNSGQQPGVDKRDMKQKEKPNRCPNEFGKIGCDSYDFKYNPHCPDKGGGKMIPAQLRQIQPGSYAQLRRKDLDEHCH